jgi:hypothetical protein
MLVKLSSVNLAQKMSMERQIILTVTGTVFVQIATKNITSIAKLVMRLLTMRTQQRLMERDFVRLV